MRQQKGFTLIELSIVLVIIALVVGGVLVGQDMIQSAMLRKEVSDIDKLKTAIATFRVKYDCLPGDCSNESSFLNMAPAEYAGGTYNPPDGNGNGQYDQNFEALTRTFEALSKAGLIEGNYAGTMYNNGTQVNLVPGYNTPNYAWFQGQANAGINTSTHQLGIYFSYDIPCPPIASGCEPSQPWIIVNHSGRNQIVMDTIHNGSFYGVGNGNGVACNFISLIDHKVDDGMPVTGAVGAYASGYSYINCLNYYIASASTPAPPSSTPYSLSLYGAPNTYPASPMWFDLGI